MAAARSPDVQKRRAAASNLARHWGPELVLPEYLRMLKDPDEEVRWSASVALGAWGKRAVAAKPDLIATLHNDVSAEVRQSVAGSLGEIGSLSESDVRALAKALQDPNGGVRVGAVVAIGGAGPALKFALPELEQAIHDPVEGVVGPAVMEIGEIGTASEPTVDQLIRLLSRDEPFGLSGAAAWTLGSLGPIANKAVPSLRTSLNSRVADTRASAARSLWKLTGDTKNTIPVLVGCLNVVISETGEHYDYRLPASELPEIDKMARGTASTALVEIGTSSKLAADAVTRSLAEAASKSGGAPSDVIEAILRRIKK
jgi:HEAT repeat protein